MICMLFQFKLKMILKNKEWLFPQRNRNNLYIYKLIRENKTHTSSSCLCLQKKGNKKDKLWKTRFKLLHTIGKSGIYNMQIRVSSVVKRSNPIYLQEILIIFASIMKESKMQIYWNLDFYTPGSLSYFTLPKGII